MDETRASPLIRQRALDLPPPPPRLNREQFLLGESNVSALKMLDDWARAGEQRLVICGPASAGKTHLARIAAEQIGARAISAYNLDPETTTASAIALVIDDVEQCGSPRDLLAAIESVSAAGGRLILVGRGAPVEWARGLKDLETRLNAATRIALEEPDEALLKAVMMKLFSDRQLCVSEEVVVYAAARLPKTLAAAEAFVAGMDAASLEAGKGVGRVLAREVVANLSEAPADA
jgi:chromosomal replication initiation ATPase DnaA